MPLSRARPYLCENEKPRRPLSLAPPTADEPAPRHEHAPNSCGGVSITRYLGDVRERYDYGPNAELIGVTEFDSIKYAKCGGSQTFSDSCSVAGEPEPLCATFCSAVVCKPGIQVTIDAMEQAPIYQRAQIEFCRNDECERAQLFEFIPERHQPDAVVDVTRGNLNDGSSFWMTLRGNTPKQSLEFNLNVVDSNKLHDGDRYRFELKTIDGGELAIIDETVNHYDVEELGEPCSEQCKRKQVDRRSFSAP